MINLVRGLSLICIVLLVAACSSSNEKIDQQYQMGQASFISKDYVDAFRQILPAAQQGNADAQYAIGYMYYTGKGVLKNRAIALNWFRLAAKQDQPDAIKALEMLQHTSDNSASPFSSTMPLAHAETTAPTVTVAPSSNTAPSTKTYSVGK